MQVIILSTIFKFPCCYKLLDCQSRDDRHVLNQYHKILVIHSDWVYLLVFLITFLTENACFSVLASIAGLLFHRLVFWGNRNSFWWFNTTVPFQVPPDWLILSLLLLLWQQWWSIPVTQCCNFPVII